MVRYQHPDKDTMKVTHVVPAIALSGVPRFVTDLAVAQAAAGHNVQVMSLLRGSQQRRDESIILREQLSSAAIPLIELNARNLRTGLPTLALRFAMHFRRSNDVILHSHDHSSEFLSAMISRIQPIARVRTIHNRPPPADKLYTRFIERSPPNELVVSVSHDVQKDHLALRKSLNLEPTMLNRVILNGISPPPKMHKPRDIQSIKNEGLRLAFFGRAVPQKGLDTLSRAIAMLDDIPLRVDIFSDAEPTAPCIRNFVARGGRVRLSPLVADARIRMAEYDAIVMPSRFEGLPLVAIEAFAAGTPIVATDAPGLREALPGNWPLTCPPDAPERLAWLLRNMQQGNWNNEHLSRIAMKHAANFGIASCAAAYEQAYVELNQMNMQ